MRRGMLFEAFGDLGLCGCSVVVQHVAPFLLKLVGEFDMLRSSRVVRSHVSVFAGRKLFLSLRCDPDFPLYVCFVLWGLFIALKCCAGFSW